MADGVSGLDIQRAEIPALARPLKVLMLTEYPYASEDERLGGIMQASFRLVSALDALNDRRLELYVLTQSPHVKDRTLRRLRGGTTIVYFPLTNELVDKLLFGYAPVRNAMEKAIEEIRPDLIHGQGTAKYIYATTHSGQRHVITVHGIYRNEMKVLKSKLGVGGYLARYAKIAVERHYARRIVNLIAITDEISSFVRNYSPGVRVFSIDNAIDETFFEIEPLRSNPAPIILFVAAITYRKGLDYLLAAFTQVVRSVPSAQLRIAGVWDWDPHFVETLRNTYSSLIQAGSVTFLGGISQEQLLEEMANSFFLCLPSRAESAPMVISQAMAAGRPVIASRVGGIPAMINDGVAGYLWDVSDSNSLSRLLLTALTDVDAARRMGRAGRAIATERYSAKSVAARTIDAYLKIAPHQ